MRFSAFLLLLLFTLTIVPINTLAADPPTLLITPPAPKISIEERHAELAKRRAAVAAKMDDKSVLVLFSAEPKLYTNDVDYVFRQENNLYYLTGLKQENATLVITKDGAKVTETIFIPKRIALREAWEGRMYSNEDATRISGVKTVVDAADRGKYLDALKSKRDWTSTDGKVSLMSNPASLYLLLPNVVPNGGQDENGLREYKQENDFSVGFDTAVKNARPIFNELRHIKSPYELKMLQHAIDITTEAQMRSMAIVGRAEWEYQVHAEVEYTFRRRNADFWGYPSIVGCGANATTLHYVESQSPIVKGQLLLMDVGAEYEHYTADVTRTYPVNGKFTKEQAEIYQIVYDAQEAAAKATKPGSTYGAAQNAARAVIRTGLAKLGLIPSADATIKASFNGQIRDVPAASIWNIHGLGHWLGMNVHDVGDYAAPFKPGMVYTNEPGIYIREDALGNLLETPENKAFIEKVKPIYERYKNIGVRIEDDMLVTETGVAWMTGKLPRSIADIEAFMAKG
ncbi:MAG: aminopeptidase P family protein, partial [Pyrinomonadaceae bacterium]